MARFVQIVSIGDYQEVAYVNVDAVAFIKPESNGSTIVFDTATTLKVPYSAEDMLSKFAEA